MASICTPTPSHAPLIRDCIEHGVHFLCEKPLTDDLAVARELDQMARDAGILGMVGFTFRYAPAFAEAKRLLGEADKGEASPILGKINNAIFRIGGRGNHAQWKHQKETGGGAINEMLVHMLDLARWLLGPLRDIELADVTMTISERVINGRTVICDAEDWVVVKARTANNVPILIQADFTTPAFSQHIEISGSDGTFFGTITPDLPNMVILTKEKGEFARGNNPLPIKPENFYKSMIASFIEAQKEGGKSHHSLVADSIVLMEYMSQISSPG